MSDFIEFLGVLVAAITIAFVMCGVVMYGTTVHADRECTRFCESQGHSPYYSSSYGCFCENEDGERYNPDYQNLEITQR